MSEVLAAEAVVVVGEAGEEDLIDRLLGGSTPAAKAGEMSSFVTARLGSPNESAGSASPTSNASISATSIVFAIDRDQSIQVCFFVGYCGMRGSRPEAKHAQPSDQKLRRAAENQPDALRLRKPAPDFEPQRRDCRAFAG